MANAGDLVTVLSMDTTRFAAGAAKARTEVKGLAEGVKGSLEKAGKATDDFMAIAGKAKSNDLEGAFKGISGAIGGLLTKLGPWGIAAGAGITIFGDKIIEKFFEGKKVSDAFGDSIESSMKKLEKMLSLDASAASFGRSIATLKRKGTVEEVTSAREEQKARIDDMQHELQQRRNQLRDDMQAAMAKGGVEFDPLKAMFGKNNELLQRDAGIRAGVVGNKAADEIVEQGKKIKELEDSLERAANRKKALDDAMSDAKANDFLKERIKLHEEDLDRIEKIRLAARSPNEKLADDLADLGKLAGRMPGTEKFIAQGMDQLFAEFAKSLPQSKARLAPALLRGSAGAISAISQAKAGSGQDPLLAEARKEVELAKQQLSALNQIKNKPEPIPVKLAGG